MLWSRLYPPLQGQFMADFLIQQIDADIADTRTLDDGASVEDRRRSERGRRHLREPAARSGNAEGLDAITRSEAEGFRGSEDSQTARKR